MAKKIESTIKTWDELDFELKRLGELKIEKERLEGEMTIKINSTKELYSSKCKALQGEMKNIEKDISRFCDANKATFINKRNKKFNFGFVSYRLTERVLCSCVDSTIKVLKSLNLDHYLRVKEEIDKEKIKELDSNILTKIGVKIVKEDKLSIEPNIEKIAAGINI